MTGSHGFWEMPPYYLASGLHGRPCRQPCSQPLAGRDSGPRASPMPLQLRSCFQFPGKKHRSDCKSAPYPLSPSCRWCRTDEILCPGNAFSISIGTSNEIDPPSGTKAPIRVWRMPSGSGKPGKPGSCLCHSLSGAFPLCISGRDCLEVKKATQLFAGI